MSLLLKSVVGVRVRLSPQTNIICIRNLTSVNEDKIEEIEDEVLKAKIEKVCNKSRLRPQHRNILFNQKPYSDPVTEVHRTVKYNRKLYGKYGSESGVNLGIMWPTRTDLSKQKEFEKIAFPHTINEMVQKAKLEIEEREKEKEETENKIIANMAKLDAWKKQLQDKIAKKEAEALAAKEKKDKLIEEVRRHFGFTVDPRDEKFKEMLALKEKEMKKKEKQARSEERERKALAKLMETHKSEFTSES